MSAVVLLVAAMLTGHPGTQVSTDMSMCRGDYGCADIPGNVIHMQPYLAWMLPRLEEVQPYQAALALIVFAHEARHVRGTTNEQVANRWADYHAPIVARLLGASKAWTARMRVWIDWWERSLSGRPLPLKIPSEKGTA